MAIGGISAFSVQRLPATSSPRRKAVQFLCLGRENRFIGNAGAESFLTTQQTKDAPTGAANVTRGPSLQQRTEQSGEILRHSP